MTPAYNPDPLVTKIAAKGVIRWYLAEICAIAAAILAAVAVGVFLSALSTPLPV